MEKSKEYIINVIAYLSIGFFLLFGLDFISTPGQVNWLMFGLLAFALSEAFFIWLDKKQPEDASQPKIWIFTVKRKIVNWTGSLATLIFILGFANLARYVAPYLRSKLPQIQEFTFNIILVLSGITLFVALIAAYIYLNSKKYKPVENKQSERVSFVIEKPKRGGKKNV